MIVIGDVEDGDFFAGEGVTKFSIQAFAVNRFHDNDEIGPFELFDGERDFGVIVEAGGVGFDARVVAENGLGSGAAKLVLGAEEEDVFHESK